MEAFSFGSYYPGDSAIHRLDPRTKLLLGFVFLITTLTVSGFRGLAPVAIFVVLTYAVSRVPVRWAIMTDVLYCLQKNVGKLQHLQEEPEEPIVPSLG